MKLFSAPIANVSYCLAENQKQFDKIVKTLGIEETFPAAGEACTHTYVNGNEVICIVQVNKKPKNKMEYYALLAHEAVHVYQEVVEWMSDKNPSAEFQAYVIQGILLDLLESIKKEKK